MTRKSAGQDNMSKMLSQGSELTGDIRGRASEIMHGASAAARPEVTVIETVLPAPAVLASRQTTQPLRRRPEMGEVFQLGVRIPALSVDYADEFLYQRAVAGQKIQMQDLVEACLMLLADDAYSKQVARKVAELKREKAETKLRRELGE
ncbi:hypothetical protein GCM10022631_07110 [Deinococcus rubellus]|uniref:hypothetical protein n=1 Tax=Deinococcus rubellus TaxID=1889240 RepID=UPI0031EC0643